MNLTIPNRTQQQPVPMHEYHHPTHPNNLCASQHAQSESAGTIECPLKDQLERRRYCTKQEIFNHETVYIDSEDFSNSPSFLKMSYENTPMMPERKNSLPNKDDIQKCHRLNEVATFNKQMASQLQKTQKKALPSYESPPSQWERKKENKENTHWLRNRAIHRNINLDVNMDLGMNIDWRVYDMDNLINIVDNMYEKAIDRKIQCNVNIELRSKNRNPTQPLTSHNANTNIDQSDKNNKKSVTIQIQKLKLMQKCRQKFRQFASQQQTDQRQQQYCQIIAQENDDDRCLSATQRVSIQLLPESNENEHRCKQQQEQEQPMQQHLPEQSQSEFISSARQHSVGKDSTVQMESQNSEYSQRFVYRMQPINLLGSERRSKNMDMRNSEFGSSEWKKPVLINYKVTKCNQPASGYAYGVIKKQEQIRARSLNKNQQNGGGVSVAAVQKVAEIQSRISSSNCEVINNSNIMPAVPTIGTILNTNINNQSQSSSNSNPVPCTNNNNTYNNNNNNGNSIIANHIGNNTKNNSNVNQCYRGVYQQILSEYSTAKLLAISKQQYRTTSSTNCINNNTNTNSRDQSSRPTQLTDNCNHRSNVQSRSQDRSGSAQHPANTSRTARSVDKGVSNSNRKIHDLGVHQFRSGRTWKL